MRAVVLAKFESSSRPGVVHEVRRGADGIVYCTCEAWRYGKTRNCRHMKAYRQLKPAMAKASLKKARRAA